MAEIAPKPGGRAIGRYVLYDEIASGGMATIHFGRLSGPVGFARTVAVKRLHPHLAKDPEFVTMFLDEARLAARIQHPNVVPTLDVVALEGEVFIVMEYVQGESLSRLLRAQKARAERPMPVRFACAIAAGVLHGLHAAHEARDENGEPLGLVHRDVSPQNVLVSSDGAPRVLDFGVAKAAGRLQDTRDGALKGKVAYMAPEQLASETVTRRSDVYAASIVLWEMLAGRRLFQADAEAALVARVLESFATRNVDPPSKHNPLVGPELDAIVMRGLDPDHDKRFATARELAQLLEKNGGLVAASEIAEWVESLASNEMSRRAARVVAIESRRSDDAPPSSPSLQDAETQVLDTGTDVGVSVVGAARASRRRRVTGTVIAALLVVGGGASLWVCGTKAPSSAGGAGAPSALASAAPSTAPSTESPVPGPSASGVASSAASAAAPSSGAKLASAPPSAVRPPAPPRSSTKPPPTPRPPKPDDCDPPYVFDAEGHKVYKRNCLK